MEWLLRFWISVISWLRETQENDVARLTWSLVSLTFRTRLICRLLSVTRLRAFVVQPSPPKESPTLARSLTSQLAPQGAIDCSLETFSLSVVRRDRLKP